MKTKIIAQNVKNMPWEPRPEGNKEIVWRYSGNPIIGRNATPSTARVFNSALVPYGDGFVGVFRADDIYTMMRVHLAHSKYGINWDLEDKPIQWVDEKGKPFQPHYAYDPRLVKFDEDDKYYIMWCTSFGYNPTIGLGYTKDFKTFTRIENAYLPFNRNGVLFPRKINGNYVMLSRPSDNGHTPFGDIFISESPDMTYWGKHRKVMAATEGWQHLKIGAGPIPIETNEGWLMIYHGVLHTCNGYVYSFGAALLDLEEPSKVLYRSEPYMLTPEETYETVGFVPNVAFPCSALVDTDDGRIAIYYGAADTYIAVAFGYVDEIIDWIKKNNKLYHGDDTIGRD